MENDNKEIEIDLKEIWFGIWKKKWQIIFVAIICAAIGFGYATFIQKAVYESDTEIYVLNKSQAQNGSIDANALNAASSLTKDYQYIITSEPILQGTIDELSLPMTTDELAAKISVSSYTDTRIIKIAVTDTVPETAKKIADKVRSLSAEKIKTIMDVDSVNTINDATQPVVINKKGMKYGVLGFAVGLFIMLAIVVIRNILDDTIKSQEDIEKYLGLSVLGLIPDEKTAKY